MIVDVVIRTYHKDIEWLNKALYHLHCNLTGFRKIIILIPNGQEHLLSHLTAERVIAVDSCCSNDYIGQQITKLQAYKHTDAEYIMFMDSDTMLLEPTHVYEFFKRGKPLIYKTHYDLVGDAKAWKSITENLLGFEITHEYMRRFPFIYKTNDLKEIDEFVSARFEKPSLFELGSVLGALSEFNLIGAYLDKYKPTEYMILDTENTQLEESKIKQYWSWGGIQQYNKEHNKGCGCN
jgi:hypothetical protein